MKNILFFTFLLFSISSFSQELISKNSTLISGLNERYYVLKANKKIKQGEYTLAHKDNILIKGNYINNNRDSVWVFYNATHDTILKYNYTNKKVLYWRCQDKFQNCNNKQSPAFYSYGLETILQRLVINLKYPENVALKGGQGKTAINVVIDSIGKISKSFVKISSQNDELDNAAKELVYESCKGDWIPAIGINGKPTMDTLTFRVVYNLQ